MSALERNRLADARRTVERGGMLQPPLSLGLRAIAKTCTQCGELVTCPDDKLRRSSGRFSFVHGACVDERVRKWHADPAKTERERAYRATTRSRHGVTYARNARARNDAARSAAGNSGKAWTSAELDLVSRDGRSLAELSKLLGRSLASVRNARYRVATDPRYAERATS